MSTDGAYAAFAERGIHRLELSTPFAVGSVNAFLIDDDPLTLVDTGPHSAEVVEELNVQLGRLGRRLEDIELVLITHQHIDHLGAVGHVANRSGAPVWALGRAVPYVEDYAGQSRADDEFAQWLMPRHGAPAETAATLARITSAYRGWASGATVERALAPGDRVTLANRSFEVCHRPGHSPSDTVFHDAENRLLIGGDHLLAAISSNPLLTRPVDGGERPRALRDYVDSLRRTREMDLDSVLPGHGDPVTDHAALITERLRMHDRRAEKLLGLIRERGRTAHELALAVWGRVAVTQAFLTLSEVIGHTDLLCAQGSVAEVERDGVVVFEPR